MKKIYFLGNFGGYDYSVLSGQTMRTRTVYESIVKYIPNVKIYKTDIYDLKYSKNYLYIIYKLFISFIQCLNSNQIIILPAQNSIRYYSYFFYKFSRVSKKRIHFVAIGGWLNDFLSVNPEYIKYFHNMHKIYVQSDSLKKDMEELGLDNVVLFHNYRNYIGNDKKFVSERPLKKVIFFSRVIKEKGVETAIKSIKKYNDLNYHKLSLDIYGPIDTNYKKKLQAQIGSTSNICICGSINPDEIINVVSSYDCMLFPTYYKGEGFPGAVLDAFTSGLPVIASDWKYNSEIITDGYNGFIVDRKDENAINDKLSLLSNNLELLNEMKKNALLSSAKYKEDNVAPILINNIIE